jgi:hypothetical protein
MTSGRKEGELKVAHLREDEKVSAIPRLDATCKKDVRKGQR